MMRLAWLVLALLTAACHDEARPQTAPTRPPAALGTTIAACLPFTLDWHKSIDMAVPLVTLTAQANLVEVETTPARQVILDPLRPPTIARFQADFERTYTVRGRRADGCWSLPYTVEVGPRNPCGLCPIPPVEPPEQPKPKPRED